MDEKRIRGSFLQLPGEIRNQIYTYIYENKRKVHVPPQIITLYRGPPQPKLHLVCKTLYAECLPFLYQNATIVLDQSFQLRKVLFRMPASVLSCVRALQFKHSTYAEPKWARQRIFKLKHDQHWAKLCSSIPTKLPNLQYLDITIQINDVPFRLNMTEPWVEDLLNLTPAPEHPLKTKGLIRITPCSRLRDHFTSTRLSPQERTLAKIVVNAHDKFGYAIAKQIMGNGAQTAIQAFHTYVNMNKNQRGFKDVAHFLR